MSAWVTPNCEQGLVGALFPFPLACLQLFEQCLSALLMVSQDHGLDGVPDTVLCIARQEVTGCFALVPKASAVHGGFVAVGLRGTWGGQDSMTEVDTAALPALLGG